MAGVGEEGRVRRLSSGLGGEGGRVSRKGLQVHKGAI
jgi:hypothetical protein